MIKYRHAHTGNSFVFVYRSILLPGAGTKQASICLIIPVPLLYVQAVYERRNDDDDQPPETSVATGDGDCLKLKYQP